MINEIIGQNVAAHRIANGMDQADLAKKIKASQPVISRLESGSAQWTIERMILVCLVFGIDSVEFLNESLHQKI